MESRIRRFRFSQRLVVFFFFMATIFVSPNAVSQDAGAFLEAEWKDTILENQRFTLKLITPYSGKQDVVVDDPQWPEGLKKVSGPYTSQLTLQEEDGSFSTVLLVFYTLRTGTSGIYKIPPIRVVPRGSSSQDEPLPQALSSKELFIPVLQNDERSLRFPLLLEWESVPETLYVGQSVPLVLIMKNLEEIDLPESVSLDSPGGAILESAEGLGDIGFSGLDNLTLFNVPMDAWMLTPSQEGALILPPAKVRIAGVNRSTARQSITVHPLPEEVHTSGAIGDFILSTALSDSTIVPGNSLTLRIRVEGAGNLNFLNMPEPVFPEGISPSVRDNADFAASSEGFRGYREKIYTIRPERLGRYEIRIPPYFWFNPKTRATETHSEVLLNFAVTGNLSGSGDSLEYQFDLMALSGNKRGEGWALYRNPFLYLFLLPGILFLGFVLLAKRFRPALLSVFLFTFLFLSVSGSGNLPSGWIGEAERLFHEDEYSQALDLYRDHAEEWEKNGSYLYNRGILAFLTGYQSDGIIDLRKAMLRMPLNKQVHGALSNMEQLMKLENQHRMRLFVHPDLLLLLLILGFNGAMVALSYSLLRKSYLPVLSFLLCLTLSLLSGGELLRTAWMLNRPLAVLRGESIVKKIPEAIASDWLTLPGGTSVEYEKLEGDFILVRTAYGLEGWIRKEQLEFLKEDFHEF